MLHHSKGKKIGPARPGINARDTRKSRIRFGFAFRQTEVIKFRDKPPLRSKRERHRERERREKEEAERQRQRQNDNLCYELKKKNRKKKKKGREDRCKGQRKEIENIPQDEKYEKLLFNLKKRHKTYISEMTSK